MSRTFPDLEINTTILTYEYELKKFQDFFQDSHDLTNPKVLQNETELIRALAYDSSRPAKISTERPQNT